MRTPISPSPIVAQQVTMWGFFPNVDAANTLVRVRE